MKFITFSSSILVRLSMCGLCLLISFGVVPLQSQLTVEEWEAPSKPPTIESTEPEAIDEDAVRSLTRQIQARGSIPPAPGEGKDHPGRVAFEKVAFRLQSAQDSVSVRIRLDTGQVLSGDLRNQILQVETKIGILPLLWSEMIEVKKENDSLWFTLHKQDRFQGKLFTQEVTLERLDASTVVVPLDQVVDVQVLKHPES